MTERPEKLEGPTYAERLDDGRIMYVTINDVDGKPFEVFVRLDDDKIFEWIVVATRLISASLRQGVPAELIADELTEIHGPKTGHIIPGTNRRANSYAARIGNAINKHLGRYEQCESK